MAHKKHVDHTMARMRQKGWSEKDIEHARKVLADDVHHFYVNKNVGLLHWMFLAALAVVNLVIGVILIPFMELFTNPGLYAVMVLVGLCFGLLYAIILVDLWHFFSFHHKFLSLTLTPILSIGSIFIAVSYFDRYWGNIFGQEREPLLTALAYTIAFIVPYMLVIAMDRMSKTSKNKT